MRKLFRSLWNKKKQARKNQGGKAVLGNQQRADERPPVHNHGSESHSSALSTDQSQPSSSTPPTFPSSTAASSPPHSQTQASLDTGSSPPAALSLPEKLWSDAYDSLKQKEPDLMEKYEMILSDEMNPENGEGSNVVAGPGDCKARQEQMHALVKDRLEKMNKGSPTLDVAMITADVLNQVVKGVSAAVEASPPVSIALSGVCLVLKGLTGGLQGIHAYTESLAWVVPRLEWYINLPKLTIPDGSEEAAEFGPVQTTIRDDVVRLLGLLILYLARATCSYYKMWGKLQTFLTDNVTASKWNEWRQEIQQAEDHLLKDVETSRRFEHIRLSKELSRLNARSNCLLETLLQTIISQDEKRKQREQQAMDGATRDRINGLIRTFSNEEVFYEVFKDRLNPIPVSGTGQWFLRQYKEWLARDSGILLLAAEPGRGKSVLARAIIDNAKSEDYGRFDVVCYFFFKDAPMQTSLDIALCAILHQLFQQDKLSVLEVEDEIQRETPVCLKHNAEKLWAIFRKALFILAAKGARTLCVFDALDEADPASCRSLIHSLHTHFNDGDMAHASSGLKIFVTCRPYERILSPLRAACPDLGKIHIDVSGLHKISGDVEAVIDYKLEALRRRQGNRPSASTTEKLKDLLTRHGRQTTYLWVRLAFEVLQGDETYTFFTESEWLDCIKSLPATVNGVYESLLSKVPTKDQKAIRYVLSAMLALGRPRERPFVRLIRDIVFAMKHLDGEQCDDSSQSFDRYESDEAFERWLTNKCGFLVNVEVGGLTFIHQTAKEFLTALPAQNDSWAQYSLSADKGVGSQLASAWQHSFSEASCHRVFAEAWLVSDQLAHSAAENHRHPIIHREGSRQAFRFADLDSLFRNRKWAVPEMGKNMCFWMRHFALCQVHEGIENGLPRSLCDVRQQALSHYITVAKKLPSIHNLLLWGHLRPLAYAVTHPEPASPTFPLPSSYPDTYIRAAVASDDVGLVRCLLHFHPDLAKRHFHITPDPGFDQHITTPTALFWCQSAAMFDLLLEAGADPNYRNNVGRTPLHYCDSPPLARRLLEAGANVSAVDEAGLTPLHTAREKGVAEVLLEYGANPRALDRQNRAPIYYVHEDVRPCLVRHGVLLSEQWGPEGDTLIHAWCSTEWARRDWYTIEFDFKTMMVEEPGSHDEDEEEAPMTELEWVFAVPEAYGCSQQCRGRNSDGSFNCSHLKNLLDIQNTAGETALLRAQRRNTRAANYTVSWLLEHGANPTISDTATAEKISSSGLNMSLAPCLGASATATILQQLDGSVLKGIGSLETTSLEGSGRYTLSREHSHQEKRPLLEQSGLCFAG